MKKLSKKMTAAVAKVDENKTYSLEEAMKLAKETSVAKFDASIDLVFNLNLDVRQADQQLRGAVTLPNGNGKSVKVLAVTEDKEAATKGGADIIADAEEIKELLSKDKYDFDVIVTTPKMMPALARFGKDLGPKGLMPNPKTGTVTPNIEKAITEIKKGQANYRTDKNGLVHTQIGKASMSDKALTENAQVIIDTIKKLKPSAVKGTYIKKLSVSATIGPAITISIN